MSSSIGKALVYLCASFVALVCVSWIGGCKSGVEPVEAVISLNATTESLKTATIVVDYSQSGAAPLSSAGHPACTSILPHVDTEFSDDGQGTLTIEAKSVQTFSGPLEVAACRMVPDVAGVAGATIAARLRVSLVGGSTPGGARLEPQRLAAARGAYRAPTPSAAGSARAATATPRPAAGGSPAAANQARPSARPATAPTPANANSMRIERDGSSGERAGSGSQRPSVNNPARASGSSDTGSGANTFGGSSSGAAAAGNASDAAVAPPPRGNDPSDNQPVAEYIVQIGVASESGPLGALQFDVDHTGSSGGWQGSAGGVNCNFDTPAGLAVCNDKGGGRLSCALVDMSGFDTPAAIVTCVFKTSEGLDAADFSLSVQDAADVESHNVSGVTMGINDLVRR